MKKILILTIGTSLSLAGCAGYTGLGTYAAGIGSDGSVNANARSIKTCYDVKRTISRPDGITEVHEIKCAPTQLVLGDLLRALNSLGGL